MVIPQSLLIAKIIYFKQVYFHKSEKPLSNVLNANAIWQGDI